MAITSNIGAQVATCESFKILTGRGGLSKKLFKFRLEGQLFDVCGTKYFAPKVGAKYRPIIQLVQSRHKSKDGKQQANIRVGWEKIL